MTSGPGTKFGTSGSHPLRGGRVDDCGSPVDDRRDFDRIHGRRDRNLPDDRPSVRRTPQLFANSSEISSLPSLMLSDARGGIVLVEISFNVEKDETRFPVAHREIEERIRREFFDDELVARMPATVREALRCFSGINPIEPMSGPRKALLKTRTVKKELGPTSKRNVSSFDSLSSESIPLSRFKSRSIATFPFATIIFSRVPVSPSGFFPADWTAEFPELLLKSKSSGSVK